MDKSLAGATIQRTLVAVTGVNSVMLAANPLRLAVFFSTASAAAGRVWIDFGTAAIVGECWNLSAITNLQANYASALVLNELAQQAINAIRESAGSTNVAIIEWLRPT